MAVNEDLTQIHERLRTIESNLRRALQAANLEWLEPTPTEGVPPEVVDLAKAGDRIGAVKRLRELTDASLSEANDIVGSIVP